MDIDLNIEWVKVQLMVRKKFDEILDIQSILFIIGLQELGMNYQEFKKEQKLDIIHIGVCTVLLPFGYYKKIGLDNDGWPHFKNVKKISNTMVGEEQELLMKRAIIKYFNL
tara:strand:+ start:1083 stop:1415 length:333 start_codon:yes stop_codon:yes gene_type:complete